MLDADVENGVVTLRTTIQHHKLAAEDDVARQLLGAIQTGAGIRSDISELAADIVAACRDQSPGGSTLDAFLEEFSLTSAEGVALMCLAESLLRIPDQDTVDRLIAERLAAGDWAPHLGHSSSLFVNASTWALMLTGKIVRLDPETAREPGPWLHRLVHRCGEPIIRTAIKTAVRVLGDQFVTGRSIEAALRRARNTPHSFDMLGEAARSEHQALQHVAAYRSAIDSIAGSQQIVPHGISIKLSALDPRFEDAQHARVMASLYPRLRALAIQASGAGIAMTLDAEEADRLELTLDLFERLCEEPELAPWAGLGIAVQAYQKRAPAIIDWLSSLAERRSHPLRVRLVKGAYWDTEIKYAQHQGLSDYPVYTRKATTDLCYLVCLERLLAAAPHIFPQFATHNALTIATVLTLTDTRTDFEFQRLHGMGEAVYAAAARILGRPLPVCVYGPVGSHEALLPYLMRRLLENGANTSFVNRFLNNAVPIAQVVDDPVERVTRAIPKRHPSIPLPAMLFGEQRRNSPGLDWADRILRYEMAAQAKARRTWPADSNITSSDARFIASINPADPQHILATIACATTAQIDQAFTQARAAQMAWDHSGAATRAAILVRAGDQIVAERQSLIALLVQESGKTLRDAHDEVREAADACYYYAAEAQRLFALPLQLPGPAGERNSLTLQGRGVFACISPWNFPLAIFVGQIAAALAAGNSVLAKPAPQTPLVARDAIRILHGAGVPTGVLHLLIGEDDIGARIVGLPGLDGVAFTGSLAVAQIINRQLAAKEGALCTLIAETGGQNALIVDSTALLEAVVDDVLRSAFNSAGQRCSSLRILLVQDDIADALIELLRDAMATLVIGDPADPATDLGPLIDEPAVTKCAAHCARLQRDARIHYQLPMPITPWPGWYFPPVLAEVSDWRLLSEEIFGPLVHLMRYQSDNLHHELAALRALGFGLTLGIHTRISGFAEDIARTVGCGNVYINRNMIGAVIGAQPFGGRGKSGTGPKSGGPHYLIRFATEQAFSENTAITGGTAKLFDMTDSD